jgi:hypothetical protein
MYNKYFRWAIYAGFAGVLIAAHLGHWPWGNTGLMWAVLAMGLLASMLRDREQSETVLAVAEEPPQAKRVFQMVVWASQLTAVGLALLMFAFRQGTLGKYQVTVWLAWIVVVGQIVFACCLFWLAHAESAARRQVNGSAQVSYEDRFPQAWLQLSGALVAAVLLVAAVAGLLDYHVVFWIAFAAVFLPSVLRGKLD